MEDLNQEIREAQGKRASYWRKLFFAIVIPVGFAFIIPELIYALPASLSFFCLMNRAPPPAPSLPTQSISQTNLPDLAGTRVMPPISCPHCNKTSDAGNVYCPYCFKSMKKRI